MLTTNKNKTKSALILLAIMLTLISMRLVWLFYHTPAEQPVAENGLLDLTEYNLNDEEAITLDGEWTFYPERLLENPQDIQANIIGNIMDISVSNKESDTVTFGTYYLKVIVNENTDLNDLFSLSIPSVNTASALFVNGHLKEQSGNVATDAADHRGKGHPYTVSFLAENDEINIMLQVSNFDTTESITMSNPIKFGSSKAISKSKSFEDTLLIAMVVILILHSMYSLLVYIFVSREKVLLLFVVGFLFPAIDELLTYNSASMEWLHLNYGWSFKFKELIYLGAALFLVQIMKSLLSNSEQYKRFKWFTVLYAISALIIIILPLNILVEVHTLFFILYFASFIAVIPLALREYFQHKNESFFIAIVIVGTTSGILWGLIKAISGVQIPFYPFDYLVAFLGFAVFWFKRFFRQNEQIKELVKEMEQADQVKDEFLMNTSHELRNPLHGMINIAQVILDDDSEQLTKRNVDNLKLLIDVGNRMTFTLNDILDITQLERNSIKLHKKSINLHSVVTGVLDMIRMMKNGKKLELQLEIPSTFPKVWADENRLIQILFNIIHNAIKYTEEGSVTIRATHEGRKATVSIEDTGIGISEATQQKIFQRYEQENASSAAIGGGIGLGLAVSKQLVELHGGTINVTSTFGKGSIFYFTLPLAEETKGQVEIERQVASSLSVEKIINNEKLKEEVKTPKAKSHLNKAQILIVDNDLVNLKILKNILDLEYDVYTATSGQDVLAQINTRDWDLIISDVMMPYMSGYELTKEIRKQFTIAELPILLLTARNQREDINTGFRAGANDYVSKPMDAIELKIRVKALTKLKQSIHEQLQMESAWLQAQIRPHFLFNTLNAIASLSEIDTTRMIRLLDQFSNYLRKSVDFHNATSFIPIKSELNLVQSYLYIEKERFRERLFVNWEIDDDLNIKIPPLIIQTLVENAIRHGILKRVEGGKICIRVTEQVSYHEIAIIDDGVGMSEEKIQEVLSANLGNSEGVGIRNTDQRLKKLYGKGLEIESKLNVGTTVKFQIPKNK